MALLRGSARDYRDIPPNWDDADDVPEWADDHLEPALLSIGGVVIGPATGTLTRPGRPPLGDAPKRQVTLRLDGDVLDRFRAGGPGWQSRINAALRGGVGL